MGQSVGTFRPASQQQHKLTGQARGHGTTAQLTVSWDIPGVWDVDVGIAHPKCLKTSTTKPRRTHISPDHCHHECCSAPPRVTLSAPLTLAFCFLILLCHSARYRKTAEDEELIEHIEGILDLGLGLTVLPASPSAILYTYRPAMCCLVSMFVTDFFAIQLCARFRDAVRQPRYRV